VAQATRLRSGVRFARRMSRMMQPLCPVMPPARGSPQAHGRSPASHSPDPPCGGRGAAVRRARARPLARSAVASRARCPSARAPEYTPEEGRLLVSTAVEWWLDIGNVRPLFLWADGAPRIEFYGGTWGALGLQLSRAVAQGGAVCVCSGCGSAYVRSGRAPQSGRSNYCPGCGPRVANRLRQRTYHARHSTTETGRLRSPGTARGPTTGS